MVYRLVTFNCHKQVHAAQDLQRSCLAYIRILYLKRGFIRQQAQAGDAARADVTMPHPNKYRASWVPSMRATGVRGTLLVTSPMPQMLSTLTLLLLSSTCKTPEHLVVLSWLLSQHALAYIHL